MHTRTCIHTQLSHICHTCIHTHAYTHCFSQSCGVNLENTAGGGGGWRRGAAAAAAAAANPARWLKECCEDFVMEVLLPQVCVCVCVTLVLHTCVGAAWSRWWRCCCMGVYCVVAARYLVIAQHVLVARSEVNRTTALLSVPPGPRCADGSISRSTLPTPAH